MALNDLIRIGQQSSKAEKAKGDFEKDDSKNLTLELAKISGIDRANPTMFSVIKRDSPNYVKTRHATQYKEFVDAQTDLSFIEVEADIPGSFAGIADDRLAPYLIGRAPLQYDGVNENVLNSHAGAYEAAKLKKDDAGKKKAAKGLLGQMVDDLKAKKVNGSIIKLGKSIIEATEYKEVVAIVEADLDARIKAFSENEPINLRSYAQGRYEAMGPDMRKPESYEVAKAAA